MAGGQVGEDEALYAGALGHPSCLARGGVARLDGALLLVVREGGLVDEEVGAVRGVDEGLAGASVPTEDELAARPRLAHHLAWLDPRRAVLSEHGLASLELSEIRALADVEGARSLFVE